MKTPDILKRIVEKRKERLAQEKKAKPLRVILNEIEGQPPVPSFYKAIEKEGLSIIGEIKKASPSKGVIRADFDPAKLAGEYEGSVDAMSVLTEQDFFMGDPQYLQAIRLQSGLPLLRKDFIIDSYQVFESRILGASCILLIAAILDDGRLSEFQDIARLLKMDTLVEVHDEEEMARAVEKDSAIIGINNRDLHTFHVDLGTTARLAEKAPKGRLIVSESGIRTGNDIRALGSRISGILAGESFMRAQSISAKAKEIKDAYGS